MSGSTLQSVAALDPDHPHQSPPAPASDTTAKAPALPIRIRPPLDTSHSPSSAVPFETLVLDAQLLDDWGEGDGGGPGGESREAGSEGGRLERRAERGGHPGGGLDWRRFGSEV